MDAPAPYIDLQSDKQYSNVIEKIIEHRRQPLVKLEETKKTNELRVEALKTFKRELNLLGVFAKKLYGFNSVFHRRLWVGQNPTNNQFVEGTVKNRTDLGNYRLRVLRLASKHKIATHSFGIERKLEPGNFSLEVDGKTYDYNFSGGTLADFAQLFNDNESIEASLIPKGDGTALVVLSSKVEGEKGRIRPQKSSKDSKDPEELLLQLGLFEETSGIGEVSIIDYPKPEANPKITLDDEGIWLEAQAQYSPFLGESLPLDDKKTLSFSLHISTNNQDADAEQAADPPLDSEERQQALKEKTFSTRQRMQVDELILDSELMKPYTARKTKTKPEATKNEVGPTTNPNQIAVLYYRKGAERLQKVFELKDLDEDRSLRVEEHLSPTDANPVLIDGIEWTNASHTSQDKSYLFSRLLYGDKKKILEAKVSQEDYVPMNEVVSAHGAKLSYKGVEVVRDANLIDDLVPNVSLTLKRASEVPLDFSIELDDKQIDDSVINFVGQYNLCIDFLNRFLSRQEPEDSLDEDLKKTYGLFANESSLRLLKEKMSRILGRVYPTSLGREFSLLSQMGLSTLFFLGDAGNIDAGKIDLDIDKYKAFVAEKGSAVGTIFGYDADGDGRFESGCAYSLANLQQAYTKGNAVLVAQEEVLRRRIDNLDTQIARKEQSIEDYRSKLQKDFRELENAIREQENMEEWFDSLDPNR